MKITHGFIAALVVGMLSVATQLHAADFPTRPTTHDGKRWRIAYYEGGPHDNYYRYLVATTKGLMALGWIPKLKLPADKDKNTERLWHWLARHADSKYIAFVDNAYYSANWDRTSRKRLKKRIIHRLAETNDIDLIFAMGTWAGKDLANNRHSTPTIVMSSSDPVKSGIVKSIKDSGFDHVFARLDPERYERQVRVFHDIIGFKTLGVAYENTVVGRSYAAIDLVEKVAKDRHFKIVRCYTQSDIANLEQAGNSVLDCFRKLVRETDAIYVTVQGGVNAKTLPQLVRMTNRHRIPTFSQLGSEEVKRGFLLSISRAGGFKPVGRFLAATIAKIFNGAKPRELNQVFEEAPNIAINLKTAEMVGLYLYADVLAAADEIYRNIAVPQ